MSDGEAESESQKDWSDMQSLVLTCEVKSGTEDKAENRLDMPGNEDTGDSLGCNSDCMILELGSDDDKPAEQFDHSVNQMDTEPGDKRVGDNSQNGHSENDTRITRRNNSEDDSLETLTGTRCMVKTSTGEGFSS